MHKTVTLSILMILIGLAACNKTIIDIRDHQIYKISKINDLWWTTQNMNFYVEGCNFYNSDSANTKKSGKIYNWEQAMQVCPTGWRLPTENELINLFSTYGKISYSGEMEAFKELFGSYEPKKTEATYFKLVNDKKLNILIFENNMLDNQRTMFWTSISPSEEHAYAIYYRTKDQYIEYNSIHFSDYPKEYYGFCRCVKEIK